jgi:hypothetical protein
MEFRKNEKIIDVQSLNKYIIQKKNEYRKNQLENNLILKRLWYDNNEEKEGYLKAIEISKKLKEEKERDKLNPNLNIYYKDNATIYIEELEKDKNFFINQINLCINTKEIEIFNQIIQNFIDFCFCSNNEIILCNQYILQLFDSSITLNTEDCINKVLKLIILCGNLGMALEIENNLIKKLNALLNNPKNEQNNISLIKKCISKFQK